MVEHEARVAVQLLDGRPDRLVASEDEADRQSSEATEVLRAMAAADPALVFVPCCGVVEDPMHAVFAGPVAAIEARDRLGIGALWRVAGDAMDQIDARRADPCRVSVAPAAAGPGGSLDQENLLDPGEADARDRFGRGPDLPLLDASVRRLR